MTTGDVHSNTPTGKPSRFGRVERGVPRNADEEDSTSEPVKAREKVRMSDIRIKRMYSATQRQEMAKSGMAMPDGSYPIKDREDLANAVSAYGRAVAAGRGDEVKAWILSRAEDLDAMDTLPDDWKKTESDAEEAAENKAESESLRVANGKVVSCAKGDVSECGYKGGASCEACGAEAVVMDGAGEKAMTEAADDEEDEEENEGGKRPFPGAAPPFGGMAKGLDRNELLVQGKALMVDRLGVKDDKSYLCMGERKVLSGSPCADCKGGCMSGKGDPGALEVEGAALLLFGGEVKASAFSDAFGVYVVDVEAAEGRVEVCFKADGTLVRWELLGQAPDPVALGEDLADPIDAKQAAEVALGAVAHKDAKVVTVTAATVEGSDAYVVRLDDETAGKSWDVYLSLKGAHLLHQEFELQVDEKVESGEVEAPEGDAPEAPEVKEAPVEMIELDGFALDELDLIEAELSLDDED